MTPMVANLRYLLNAHGISENQLSEETGVPQPTINRILRGKSRDPRDRTVEPIATYFGLTIDQLKRGDVTKLGALPIPLVHRPSGDAPLSASHPMRPDADILRAALASADRVIPRLRRISSRPVTQDHRLEIILALYNLLAERRDMAAAERIVAGMFRAFADPAKVNKV